MGIPDHPDNAFSREFLDRFGRRDQPPTTEADTAGPWTVRAAEGGFGIYAPAAGEPEAVFYEWELAFLCAAAFPASDPFPSPCSGSGSGG